MSLIRRWKLAPVLAGVMLLTSGCYWAEARVAEDNQTPVPWFCDPVAENSVTGPGMGSVDFYAGDTRAPLDYTTCSKIAFEFDQAKAYAKQFPTLGSAEANGFRSTFAFIPGMGTHHGRDSISPALLADPSFDPQDPIIPNSIIDGVFNPAQPEFLQYNGNGPDAKLVGISYYVRTADGQPPEGFTGANDWWHHHPTLCLNPSTAQAFGVNTTDAGCARSGGINVHLQKYFMLHLWLVDDLEFKPDVHGPIHPCILGSGAIFDMTDPCHQAFTPASALGATTVDKASAHMAGCPIGTLGKLD